ncbi:family 16 glycosylhydrolase [Pseudonocardia sp. CA-107938]|uniref:glycoside hydrolase family 16 protein n=1 Tax=Pseudonocardia sp. CA-107938 TaxID=3240021 RepID=UPI003D9482AA
MPAAPAPSAPAEAPAAPAGPVPAATDPGAGPAAGNPAGPVPAAIEPQAGSPNGPAPATPAVGDTSLAPQSATTRACAEPASAATTMRWGTPTRSADFTTAAATTTAREGWTAYTGTGFAGRGTRTPDALSVADGILTITGDAQGATGGMAWGTGQAFGRWEVRARVPAGDPVYNAVLMLWSDDDNGAEIDFMELQDPARAGAIAAVHAVEGGQAVGKTAIDATQWHNWAVEWTPTRVTTYVDGHRWFETTDAALIPKGPMHLCVQLDYFGTGGPVTPSSMQVDWVRQYPSTAGTEGDRTEGWPDRM